MSLTFQAATPAMSEDSIENWGDKCAAAAILYFDEEATVTESFFETTMRWKQWRDVGRKMMLSMHQLDDSGDTGFWERQTENETAFSIPIPFDEAVIWKRNRQACSYRHGELRIGFLQLDW
jgi:hypothetical protein